MATWNHIRETLQHMVHAYRVGTMLENGHMTADQAREAILAGPHPARTNKQESPELVPAA